MQQQAPTGGRRIERACPQLRYRLRLVKWFKREIPTTGGTPKVQNTCTGTPLHLAPVGNPPPPPSAGDLPAVTPPPPSYHRPGSASRGKNAETRGRRVWKGPCYRAARTTEHMFENKPTLSLKTGQYRGTRQHTPQNTRAHAITPAPTFCHPHGPFLQPAQTTFSIGLEPQK